MASSKQAGVGFVLYGDGRVLVDAQGMHGSGDFLPSLQTEDLFSSRSSAGSSFLAVVVKRNAPSGLYLAYLGSDDYLVRRHHAAMQPWTERRDG
jgi:hypothetical protein